MDTSTYNQSTWWLLTIQGILGILFGIACVFWPGITLVSFIYLFAAWVLVGGLIAIFRGVISIGRGGGAWILTLLLGILELGVGVFLLRNPGVSFAVLILLVSFTLIFFGIFEIVVALADRAQSATAKTLTIITGVIAAVAGVIMLFQPASSGVAFVWIIGLFALINGPIWIAMSLDVKRMTDDVRPDKKRVA